MNLEILKARHAETLAAMRALVTEYSTRDDDFSEEDQKRFDELQESATADKALIDSLIARTAAIVAATTAGETDGQFNINTRGSDDPYDLTTLGFGASARDLRSRAATAIEQDQHLPDDAKQAATLVMRNVDKRGEIATLILGTGSAAYRSAFQKVVGGNNWALNDDEREALSRAQSLTNGAGGFAVPFTLDPTVILTNDGSINPLRQMATVKTTTTDDWNGVTSAGATASWDAEAAEVSDDAITLVQPNIPVHKMAIFIPFSIEVEGDWVAIEAELRAAMVDAKDRLEATAHVLGTGTGQPFGVVTALDGTASEIAPQTAETFAQADVFNLRRVLPPRHRMNREMPSWLANIGTYDSIRQFDTGGGGGFWTDMTDGTPDRLLGHSTHEASAMEDAADIDAAASEDNRILVVGDFKKYVIVDRVGMRVETIPHLFATANNRPNGQRGLYAMLRTGADVIDNNAFRMLNVATTA